ncbi:hypothetical protein [Bartonella sp. CB169]|uniref:hypothetical protein n=1 Tax=Bartonella sp. CB169 TaxID=3112257 RepID=UPI00300E43D9
MSSTFNHAVTIKRNIRRLSLRIEQAQHLHHHTPKAADTIYLVENKTKSHALFALYEKLIADSNFSVHLFYHLHITSVDSRTALTELKKQLLKIIT